MDHKYDSRKLESLPSEEHQPKSKQNGLKSILKRFWWVSVVLFLTGVLIVTLCLCYVAMPAIAQKNVDNSQLILASQVVVNPTPNSVRLQMTAISLSKSAYHPQLDPFQAALFLEDTEPDILPFGYLNIPHVHATANTTIYVDQELEIVNTDQFARYTLLVLQSKEYRVALRGRVSLKEMAFPKTTVNFNKVVTSPGLNGLSDLEIRNVSISLQPAADGSNMQAQAFIPNPSPITIGMGTITMNVFVDGQQIAVATIPDLLLTPGDNLINMTSVADQTATLNLITSKYTNGKLPITLVGNSSTWNGIHLTYFEEALQQNTISTTLDLGPALQALGINITST